ncbi:hypothetical protein EJ06DRAFT_3861 [Trichodelitschia bisporula]|uniref:Uncharacterized protein n=1 Tax=Trichodelitschia bisporula TaxID=703511 RepID=A0A6G1I9X6_9PEZI|nr:hypothetical protein EJ06DRAFT_3861 [Trichodelitschia bisporula]
MLPPVPPTVLERNPRFKALYQDLSTSRLNPDASTRLIKQQRAQADIEKTLQTARTHLARTQLLTHALAAISSHPSLAPELVATTRVAAAQLAGELSRDEGELLADDLEYFVASTPTLSPLLTTHLTISAQHLSMLLSAPAEAAPITSISSLATSLSESLTTQTATIASTHLRITELSAAIQSAQRELLESAVRVLEQTVHGAVARGTKAKAEHLGVVARGLELKLQILAQTDPVTNDAAFRGALRTYAAHLDES